MALFETAYEVSASELEAGYHVHHSYALRLLERGRLSFMEALGVPDPQLRAQGILLVIASISIRYLRELFAERVTVTVEAVRHEGKSLHIEQRLLNHKGKTAVTAVVECVPLALAARRAVPPPPELLAALGAYEQRTAAKGNRPS